MTAPLDKIALFGQQTVPKVQQKTPGISQPVNGPMPFGTTQPLDKGFDKKNINFNPFGQLAPQIKNEQVANKLDLFG